MTSPNPIPRRPRARRTTVPEEPMSTITAADPAPPSVSRSRLPALPALRPLSPTPTYVGIGVVALGFVLLAVAWGGVAGKDNVALQVPYLVSGGLAGIGLILVGLTVVNIAAKRRDSALREQQIQVLAAALEELRGGER
jgi:hypothetical protein